MKKIVFILLLCLLVNITARAEKDDGYIHVDWYPLLTDSVGWNIYSGDFVLGWNNAHDIDVTMGKSIDIGWLTVIGAKYNTGHGQRITMGVGIDWRNYRLNSDVRFTGDGEGLAVAPYPDGASKRLSRVKVFSLTMPILFKQRIVDKLDIFAGPVVNFNLHSSVLTQYQLNDEKVKESRTGIHQVPVTVDIMGGLKWRGIGVYIRYSPCHVLKEEYAPAFTPLTVGLGLAL